MCVVSMCVFTTSICWWRLTTSVGVCIEKRSRFILNSLNSGLKPRLCNAMLAICYVWEPSLPTQQKQRLVTQIAERPPILTQYFTRAAAAVLCWWNMTTTVGRAYWNYHELYAHTSTPGCSTRYIIASCAQNGLHKHTHKLTHSLPG